MINNITGTLPRLNTWRMLGERGLADLDDMLSVPAVVEEGVVAVQEVLALEKLVNKVRTEALLVKFYLQLQLYPFECQIQMQRPYGKNESRSYIKELRSANEPFLVFNARQQSSPCVLCSPGMGTMFGVGLNDDLSAGWAALDKGLDMENWVALKNTVLQGEAWCGPLPLMGKLNGEQHTYWALGYGAPVVLGKQVTQWTLQLHDVTAVQQLCHDRVQVAIVILEAKKLLASLQAFLELAGPVFQLEGAEAAYTDQQLEATRADLLDSKVLTRSDDARWVAEVLTGVSCGEGIFVAEPSTMPVTLIAHATEGCSVIKLTRMMWERANSMGPRDFLCALPLLKELAEPKLQRLMRSLEEQKLRYNQVLVELNAPLDWVHFVRQGSLSVAVDKSETPQVTQKFGIDAEMSVGSRARGRRAAAKGCKLQVVALIGEGDAFPVMTEGSENGRSMYRVSAASEGTLVYSVPAAVFKQIVATPAYKKEVKINAARSITKTWRGMS